MIFTKIIFAGDFFPGGLNDVQKLEIDSEIKSIIKGNSNFFINLEAPVTESDKKRIKAGPCMKIDNLKALIIKELKVTGVSLANNHIFDYGETGLNDTMHFLKNNAINYWGIGSNKTSAWEPFIFDADGIKVAVVSYAEHEFNWLSDDQWCTSMLEPSSNVLQILELKKKVDHVIVYTHTGPENWHYPSPRQVVLFRNFIDAGASAVLNSHSHSVMGMEWYKDRPIYYSLGNFFFPETNNKESWYKGLMVEINLYKQDNLIETNHIPVRFSEKKIALDKDILSFEQSFTTFSKELNNNTFILEKWNEFGILEQKKLLWEIIKGTVAVTLGILLGPFSKRFKVLKYKGIAVLRGYAYCENHMENISNILNYKLNLFNNK